MKKEMKCYNVIFEGSEKKYLYLADEMNSSDSGYIGKWLFTPDGKKIKILSIVFYPKAEIDELPYTLKKLNLGELSFEVEPDSVAMAKKIFRDMGIMI